MLCRYLTPLRDFLPLSRALLLIAFLLCGTTSNLNAESVPMSEPSFALPNHQVEQFTIDSSAANFRYEVLLSGPPEGIAVDGPLPLLIVLDGFLLGMSAIENVRLMGATGEIEPLWVAAVSPDGGFAMGNFRRLKDFSIEPATDLSEDPRAQALAARFEGTGIAFEDAIGGSDAFRTFLMDELLPELHSRRSIDAQRLGLMGHSAGGSFVIETLLKADAPIRDFIIGEAATTLMFGLGDTLVDEAKERKSIPAKRVFYGDSGDTRTAAPWWVDEADHILGRISDELKVPVSRRAYPDKTHTSMVGPWIVDGLLHMYGTGVRYSDSIPKLADED